MKKARLISALLALLFAMLSFAGCEKQTTLTADEIKAETEDYIYFRSDNEYYIYFKKNHVIDPDESNTSPLIFSGSYKELRNTLLTNSFRESTRQNIQYALADENGCIRVPDIDNINAISHYDLELTVTKIEVEKDFYSISYEVDQESYFHVTTETYYERSLLEKQCLNAINSTTENERITDIKTGDRNATEYYINQYYGDGKIRYRDKYVHYTLEDNDKKLYVIEKHAINNPNSGDDSNTTLTRIDIYCDDNGLYYYLFILYNKEWNNKRPSSEWLLSFTMNPIEENE